MWMKTALDSLSIVIRKLRNPALSPWVSQAQAKPQCFTTFKFPEIPECRRLISQRILLSD